MIKVLLRFLASLGNQKNRLYKEINELRRTTSIVQKDLIPLEEDELTNISTYRYTGKKAYSRKPVYFTTVFNETVGAIFEQPIGKSGDHVVVIYLKDYEYAFIKNGASLELFVNERPFGKMNHKGIFYNLELKAAGRWDFEFTGNKRRFMAGKGSHADVSFGERNALTDRMFSSFKYNTYEELHMMLALSLYERLRYGPAIK